MAKNKNPKILIIFNKQNHNKNNKKPTCKSQIKYKKAVHMTGASATQSVKWDLAKINIINSVVHRIEKYGDQ